MGAGLAWSEYDLIPDSVERPTSNTTKELQNSLDFEAFMCCRARLAPDIQQTCVPFNDEARE